MRILRGTALKKAASAIALVAAGVAMTTSAEAGGFAIREQSAYYQGMSFAGAGTGDTLSSMYWNSAAAAAAAAPGMNSESHVSLIIPDTEITATGGALTGFGAGCVGSDLCQAGEIADGALVPASYANYQVNERLYLGIATNSGFGLVTKPDNTDWAGSALAITSDVFSINANPTVAYKLTDELTVGVGVQIEYLNVRLTNAPSAVLGTPGRSAELDDIGVGATAGVTWKPAPGTTVGVGYRSAVSFDLEGDYNPGAASFDADAELTLPDIVTVGLRQSVTDRMDVLLGYEWTNWSRAGSIPVNLTGLPVPPPETLRLEYDDGHFVSAGVEYAYSADTMLRAGVAWEKSPISDEERNVLLPDADRLWLSLGATHNFSENITIDVGYTHIFTDDAPICRESAGPAGPCTGASPVLIEAEADSSVDIISASVRYKWGGGEPDLEPLK